MLTPLPPEVTAERPGRTFAITELAVREVIHGRPVANVDALANPSALDLFRNLHELQT
jgi:acetoacetyl-CoA synthetase